MFNAKKERRPSHTEQLMCVCILNMYMSTFSFDIFLIFFSQVCIFIYFIYCLLWGRYNWWYLRDTPCFVLRDNSYQALETIGLLRIKPESATCKTATLPVLLLLWPQDCVFKHSRFFTIDNVSNLYFLQTLPHP